MLTLLFHVFPSSGHLCGVWVGGEQFVHHSFRRFDQGHGSGKVSNWFILHRRVVSIPGVSSAARNLSKTDGVFPHVYFSSQVVIKSIREISLQKTTSLEEEYTNTGTDSNGDAQPGTTLGEKFMMAPYVQTQNVVWLYLRCALYSLASLFWSR